MSRDYVGEILETRTIDMNIFNQINDNFNITRGYMGLMIKKKCDGDVKMDYYVMYFMFEMQTDTFFTSIYTRSFNGLDNDMKMWVNDVKNDLVVNVIMASEYVMTKMLVIMKPFQKVLKDVPNYFIGQWSIYSTWNKSSYPTIGNINNELSIIWNNIKIGSRYISTFPMVDVRNDYLKKEKIRRAEMYVELDKYLIDNNIKRLFDLIVANFFVEYDICKSKVITINNFTHNKCIVNGHNVCDIIKFHDNSFLKNFNLKELDNFVLYDRNAIIASFLVKKGISQIRRILELRGPELCDVLVNNTLIDKKMKQTFMLVSKYFNDMVKKMDVKFTHDSVVGCKEGCGNKILICFNSVMNSLPRCEECEGGKIYYMGSYVLPNNWAQCSMCKCLFFVPYDDNPYYGKNPKCEICRVK